jgi:hypothetical protein
MPEPTLLEVVHDGFVRVETWDVGGDFPIEVIRTTDSVSGVLVDIVRKRVLLVSQCRVPMITDDNPTGFMVESVAGRFDVDLGPKQLLIKEALEEAGVTITEDDVHIMNGGVPMSLSAGILTERCYGAVAVIKPEMVKPGDTGRGVKEEGEDIDRVWIPFHTFIHPETIHASWRTWAFAQHLRANQLQQLLTFGTGRSLKPSGYPVDLTDMNEA